MKALICGRCFDIRGLAPEGPVFCRCGHTRGRWVNPQRGIAKLATSDDSRDSRVLGVHNQFLAGAFPLLDHRDHVDLHKEVTNAPGYLFDSSKRGCWAVIIAPGESNDTSWESWGLIERTPVE